MNTSPTIEQPGNEQYRQTNTTGAATDVSMMSNVTTPPPKSKQIEDQSDLEAILNEEYWKNKDLSKQPLPLDFGLVHPI